MPEPRAVLPIPLDTRDAIAEALRAADRHRAELEAVYDAISDGLMVVEAGGAVVFANDAFVRLGGFASLEELRAFTSGGRVEGARFEIRAVGGSVVPPERWPLARVLRGEAIHEEDLEIRRLGGEARWLSYNAQPVRDREGAQFLAVIVARDVTARRAAEEARRASEEEARTRAALLEAVLDCVADGVIVYDAQGRTLRSSPAADEMVGIPRADRAGPVADRVEGQYEILTEDGRALRADETAAVRSSLHGETIRGAVQQVRPAGREPRWLMINAIPLVVSGRHTGAVLSLTDVTDRKRAEAELAIVTRLYAVLSRVNEAIVRTRDEARLLPEVCRIVASEGGFPLVWVGLVRGRAVAPAAAAGAARAYLDEIQVEVDGELGQGPTGTSVREGRAVINDDFAVNASTWPWRAPSARHGLRASAAFPLRRAGVVVGAITFYAGQPGAFTPKQVSLLEALCADVSYALDAFEGERLRTQAEQALRRSEQGLREADRRKDEFLSMLSHELRNPLAPIRNAVQILRHAAPDTDQAARARTVIERQTAHLTRVVDDLLDVTRIARGKVQLRRATVELRELVLRAADDFRVLLEERGIDLQVAVPPARAWVDADPTRLAQVLGNLLHNAAKFAGRGDRVVLALRVGDATAELQVSDTGAGIDPALLPAVFDAFVQGERTLARTEGGLGLGLALVKGLVELHGGTVRAESAGVGEGATFTLTLPLVEGVAGASGGAPDRGAAARRRVLVVDDNADAADTLADLLRTFGHEVEVAYDGPAALARARAAPPEVVLCDIGLPGMSGYDVARALRADAKLSGTLLVALTGYAQAEDRQRAQQAGFDVHLAKPPELEELVAVLRGGR
jgi:PAS domain S-box-containing protein